MSQLQTVLSLGQQYVCFNWTAVQQSISGVAFIIDSETASSSQIVSATLLAALLSPFNISI